MVSVPKLQLHHLRLCLRVLFVMTCGTMIFDMLDPAFLILTAPNTMLYRVATLTHQPAIVAYAHIFCSLFIVPLLVVHMLDRWHTHYRLVTKIAMLGLVLNAVEWAYLCFLGWRVETGSVLYVYIRTIIGTLMFAGFLGVLLNNELRRERELEEQRKRAEENLLKNLLAKSAPITKDESDVQQSLENTEQSGC